MMEQDENSPLAADPAAGPPPAGGFAPAPADQPVLEDTPAPDQPPAAPAAPPTRRPISPLMRETRKIIDDLMEKVPGYSKTLPPMRDGLGDPILPPPGFPRHIVKGAIPILDRPNSDDPVRKEGARLSVRTSPFPTCISAGRLRDDFDINKPQPGDLIPVAITPQERDRWILIYRDMIRDPETGFQATVLDQGRYIDAPDYAKGEMYLGALARYKVAARDALLAENDQLRTKVFANTAESNQHLFQQEPTPAAYPDKSPDLFDGLTPEQQRNLLRWGNFAPRPPEPEPDTRNSFKVREAKPVELAARTDVKSDADKTSSEDNQQNQITAAVSKNQTKATDKSGEGQASDIPSEQYAAANPQGAGKPAPRTKAAGGTKSAPPPVFPVQRFTQPITDSKGRTVSADDLNRATAVVYGEMTGSSRINAGEKFTRTDKATGKQVENTMTKLGQVGEAHGVASELWNRLDAPGEYHSKGQPKPKSLKDIIQSKNQFVSVGSDRYNEAMKGQVSDPQAYELARKAVENAARNGPMFNFDSNIAIGEPKTQPRDLEQSRVNMGSGTDFWRLRKP